MLTGSMELQMVSVQWLAWWCDEQAELQGNSLTDYELMEDIRAYNEIDCKAMHEIISYMRIKH